MILLELKTSLSKIDYPLDIVMSNILKCLNRNRFLLRKYDYSNILHFIPNPLNYNTKYSLQKR